MSDISEHAIATHTAVVRVTLEALYDEAVANFKKTRGGSAWSQMKYAMVAWQWAHMNMPEVVRVVRDVPVHRWMIVIANAAIEDVPQYKAFVEGV